MSALLSTIRHAATRLDVAADHLPSDMLDEYRASARALRTARERIEGLPGKIRARVDSAQLSGNRHPQFLEGLRCAANIVEAACAKDCGGAPE